MSNDLISRRNKVSRENLTGSQKTAILLMALGTQRAAKVLGTLSEPEITEIMAEVSRLDEVPADVVEEVLDEFDLNAQTRARGAAGGVDMVRRLLEASVGPAKTDEIVGGLSAAVLPFESARRIEPRRLIAVIGEESPQTIALVMAHLSSEAAAALLAGLTPEAQRDVAVRLATLESPVPAVVAMVEEHIERRLGTAGVSEENSAAGGARSLADLLDRTDRATERLIFEGLEAHDRSLADEVRSLMFVFEDIVALDDMAVQKVLRNVDAKTLALSLKGAREDVRDKVLANVSTRAAENLVEEVELLGPVRLAAVEDAQRSLVETIRELEESGSIQIRDETEEFVE